MFLLPKSIGNDYYGLAALPRELLQFDLSPETLARDSFLLNVASVSALTWVVYDMVLNFNREINLVWRRWREPKGCHSRRLYVIIRYFSVVNLAWYVGVNTSVGLSLNFCRAWYYIVLVNATIITLLPDILLLIRVNAVYSWNIRTLLLTIFLFMIQMTTSLVAGVLAVNSAQFSTNNPFPVSGCPAALSSSVARFTLVAWIPSMLAQATYLALMLNTLAHLMRSLDVGSPSSPRLRATHSTPDPTLSPAHLSTHSSLPMSHLPSSSRSSHAPTPTVLSPSPLPSHCAPGPHPSPLASTSTLFSPPPDSEESSSTLIHTIHPPTQADDNHETITRYNPNTNDEFNTGGDLCAAAASGSGNGNVRIGEGVKIGDAVQLDGAENSLKASSPSSTSVKLKNRDDRGKEEPAVESDVLDLKIRHNQTISIQDRAQPRRHPNEGKARPEITSDLLTASEGSWRSVFSWKALKQVRMLVPTMMVFVGHGWWYFALAISMKVVNAVMVTTYAGPLQALAIPLMMGLYPVLVSQIYLSMVQYLHFRVPMKKPRLLASYEGENYASGYSGSDYEDDDEDDEVEDDQMDHGRLRGEDTERALQGEERFTLGRLNFSLGGSRSARNGEGSRSNLGNGRGRGRGLRTGRGRGSVGPRRGHKPRGPRLGRITFAARESLANSSVLDLGFGNEEY